MSLGKLIALGTVGSVAVLSFLLWGVPAYRVYSAEQDGKAILARAEYARKAQIADAEAKLQSAEYLKQAADKIQSALSDEYLEYLNIQMKEEVAAKNDRAVYFFEDRQSKPAISIADPNKTRDR